MLPVYSIVTPPAEEPVSLTEAQEHVRQDSTADNTLLTRLITVARQSIEKQYNCYLVTQTVDAFYPCFPAGDRIKITRGPLQSVTSVQYVTSADVTETFAASLYDVDPRRSAIVLKYAALWPIATLRPADAVIVRCVMGYGNAAAVPQNVKQAVLMRLGHLYAHREEVTLGAVALESRAMLVGVDHLMSSERRFSF